MQRHIPVAIAVALGVAAGPAAGQQFLGRVGGGCTTLPANNQQQVSIDTTIPAAATVFVTVATSSNFVSDLTIGDATGSHYQALGGTHGGSAGTLVHFRAILQRPLNAGSALNLSYGNASTAVQSCVSVLGYRGIPAGAIVQDALGAATGQSTTPAVTATAASAAGQQFVLASFATNANPGGVNTTPPATALPAVCSADNSLCILDAWYAGDAIGTANVQLTIGSPANWSGALTALYADGIFGNGFD